MTEIYLDATLQSDLQWKCDPSCEQIHWCFDFGELKPCTIACAERAVSHFIDTLYLKYIDRSQRVRLYNGQPKEDLPDYLDRLVALLPEQLPATAIFDTSALASRAESMRLISTERYPWIEVENRPNPSLSSGLLFPIEELCTAENRAILEPLIDIHRICYEYNFTESWQGLDHIIVFPHMLSSVGERKLQGFLAAGGSVEKRYRDRGI